MKGLMRLEDYTNGPEVVAGAFLALLMLFSLSPEKYGFSSVLMALIFGILMSTYLEERPWTMKRLKALNDTLLEPLFFFSIGAGSTGLGAAPLLLAATITLSKFVGLFTVTKDWRKAALGLSKGGADGALLLASGLSGSLYSVAFLSIVLGALIPSLLFRGKGEVLRLCGLPLDKVFVTVHDKLEEVAKVLGPERPAVVVLKGDKPIGWVSTAEVLAASPEVSVDEVMNIGVPTFDCNTPLWKVLLLRGELGTPVVAVTEKEKFVGSLVIPRLVKVVGGSTPQDTVDGSQQVGKETAGEGY